MTSNRKPSLFVGSSSEGLDAAREVQYHLDKDADVDVWDESVFGLSESYIESLCEAAGKADFAVLVMTPDDVRVMREQESITARDNVVFELGLFIGALGRSRCFFVHPEDGRLKLPSDLQGVTAATYTPRDSGSLRGALGPPCTRIRERIRELGPRKKFAPDLIAAHERLQAFCRGLEGQWWERITPDDSSALSFVTVSPDHGTGMIKLEGTAYDREGREAATWETLATCVNFSEKKVFYYWTGWNAQGQQPARFEGFGEITFSGPAHRADAGTGFFADSKLADASTTTNKLFRLRRCDEQEAKVMSGDDAAAITELVNKKLGQLR